MLISHPECSWGHMWSVWQAVIPVYTDNREKGEINGSGMKCLYYFMLNPS
uniref:Uncharacterized protein n=1 Tax=Anguilla anguilla TaxID=7936 RepID=A0A0E9QAR0_ANGAN